MREGQPRLLPCSPPTRGACLLFNPSNAPKDTTLLEERGRIQLGQPVEPDEGVCGENIGREGRTESTAEEGREGEKK